MEKMLEKEFLHEFNMLLESKEEEQASCAYLLELFSEYSKDFHALAEIEKAYNFASKLHEGQFRDSGEPYIVHPLAVAIILAEMHADKNTIIAGLLHDMEEDTNTSQDNISQLFNGEVGRYVDGVSKVEPIKDTKKLNDAEYKSKLIIGMCSDLEIMIIKLADKLNNMRTLSFKSPEKRIKTAKETLGFFVPFAECLGMYKIKNELEDLSFKNINPECYQMIKEVLYETLRKRLFDIKGTIDDIHAWLSVLDIESTFKFSTKNIYGIYNVIKDDLPERYDINTIRNIIEQKKIHDLISVQIIVQDESKCYEANQIISSYYKVNKTETKDYIKNPKPNLYKSLHTTIYEENGKMLQVQLRTASMDIIANYGLAALWDLSGPTFAKTDMRNAIKDNIIKLVDELDKTDTDEFMNRINEELLMEDSIVVYTPNGDPIKLPKGATAIDFAYKIHTGLGNHLAEAVINKCENQTDSIFMPLNDGDRIYLIKSEEITVDPVWLDHCKTYVARKKIKECLRKVNQQKRIDELSAGVAFPEKSKIKGLNI